MTPAFSRSPTGSNSEVASSRLLSQGPRRGRKCYGTPAFSGVPNAKCGERMSTRYLTPTFSGPRRGRKCYVTLALPGVPDAKRRGKIRSGYLTPAFSGAPKRAEVLRNPCIPRGPQRQAQGEIQKWLPNSCLLRGLAEGGHAR